MVETLSASSPSSPNGGLGRIPVVDERDWEIAPVIRELGLFAQTLPTFRYWRAPGLPINQGSTPQCVGYATRGFLNAAPIFNPGGPSATVIYQNAQLYDGIPGEGYAGTNARGAMKYLQMLGYVSTYVWARTVAEIERWVALQGPMLLGIDWWSSFDYPTVNAQQQVLRIAPTAFQRGGHEVLIIGINRQTRMFRGINSWGPYYGANGRFWLPYDVLERLMGEGGDAVTPTEILKRS